MPTAHTIATTQYLSYGVPHILPHQSAAISALVTHLGDREPTQVRPIDYNTVAARWADTNGEEILVSLGPLGELLRVRYSALTAADGGAPEVGWHDCVYGDGLWDDLTEVITASGVPRPHQPPARRTRRAA